MKKRIMGILLSVALLISVLSVCVSAGGTHEHTLCNKTSGACQDPAHRMSASGYSHGSAVTWEEWNTADSLPASGNYYLSADVTLPETWVVSAEIKLDLNGHNINLAEGKSGSVITVANGGVLSVCDCKNSGKISGGNAEKGGGVYVASGAKFYFYSGNISGNTAINAGGIYAVTEALVRIYGGKVTENTAEDGYNVYTRSPYYCEGALVDGNVHAVWGGVEWEFTVTAEDGTGTLTVRPTEDTREIDPQGSVGQFPKGVWREAVYYAYNGTPVAIDSTPYDNSKVTSLIIEDGVTEIGSFVAKNMPIDGEVIIPSSVVYIGQEAFQGAEIDILTFADAEAKAEGDIPALCIASGAFKSIHAEEVVFPARLRCLHAYAILNSQNLEHITFLSTDTVYGGSGHWDYSGGYNSVSGGGTRQLFSYCWNLKSITFANETLANTFLGEGDSRYSIGDAQGCTLYTLDGLLDEAAKTDGKVTIKRNASIISYGSFGSDTVVIPEGVTLEVQSGVTLTIGGVLVNLGEIVGEGTIANSGYYYASSDAESEIPIGGRVGVAYKVKYNLNGGSVSKANPAYYLPGNAEFTLNNPTKTGYTFTGWSGSDLTGDNNQTVTVGANSTGDKAYAANWEANAYTVKFNSNGGKGEMADLLVSYDEETVLTANSFAFENKTFTGWNTAADGSGESFTDKQSILNLSEEDGAQIILYAQWKDIPVQSQENKPAGQDKGETAKPEPVAKEEAAKAAVPKTDDSSHITMWAVLLVISAGIAVAVSRKKYSE